MLRSFLFAFFFIGLTLSSCFDKSQPKVEPTYSYYLKGIDIYNGYGPNGGIFKSISDMHYTDYFMEIQPLIDLVTKNNFGGFGTAYAFDEATALDKTIEYLHISTETGNYNQRPDGSRFDDAVDIEVEGKFFQLETYNASSSDVKHYTGQPIRLRFNEGPGQRRKVTFAVEFKVSGETFKAISPPIWLN